MENFVVFNQFKDSLVHYQNQSNGNRVFHAEVIFTFGNERIIDDLAKVSLWLNGYDAGTIELLESPNISDEGLYTEFSAERQEYSLTPENGLRIRGTGEKTGKYSVVIKPIKK